MGGELPIELKAFYREIGYGFLCIGIGNNVNRIISATEITNFIEGINDYENDLRREYYDDPNELVFFKVPSEAFIVLDLKQENSNGQCPLYYFDKRVADSIEEFIVKMDKNPNYYAE